MGNIIIIFFNNIFVRRDDYTAIGWLDNYHEILNKLNKPTLRLTKIYRYIIILCEYLCVIHKWNKNVLFVHKFIVAVL